MVCLVGKLIISPIIRVTEGYRYIDSEYDHNANPKP